MKKCPYCEAKREISKYREPSRFFGRCMYCYPEQKKLQYESERALQAKMNAMLDKARGFP